MIYFIFFFAYVLLFLWEKKKYIYNYISSMERFELLMFDYFFYKETRNGKTKIVLGNMQIQEEIYQ